LPKALVPRLTESHMSLETCLDYINEDELVEVTPVSFRMRKKILNTNERKKVDSRK
jgi:GTP-binding protein